jgi:hypothetical protein
MKWSARAEGYDQIIFIKSMINAKINVIKFAKIREKQNTTYIPNEISRAERNFQTWITCGKKAMVVQTPATRPITSV